MYAGVNRVHDTIKANQGIDFDADAVTQVCGGCCMVFAGEDGNYKYAVGQKNGDLRGLVRELNAALDGRGGGKPEFAQGSVQADRAQIKAFYDAYFEKLNL